MVASLLYIGFYRKDFLSLAMPVFPVVISYEIMNFRLSQVYQEPSICCGCLHSSDRIAIVALIHFISDPSDDHNGKVLSVTALYIYVDIFCHGNVSVPSNDQ